MRAWGFEAWKSLYLSDKLMATHNLFSTQELGDTKPDNQAEGSQHTEGNLSVHTL